MRDKARRGESKMQRHNSCGKCDGQIIAGHRVGENNIGREKRTPFACGGAVFGRAADEFVSAVEFPNEPCFPKESQRFACVFEGEPVIFFYSHAISMAQGVGHLLSK